MLMKLLAAAPLVVWLSIVPARADPITDALEAARAGDLRGAIEHYSEAIESGQLTDHGLALAFHNRGAAYHELGEYQRAIQDYDTGLRYQPSDAHVDYTNRGRAYFELSEYRQAIEDFDSALSLNSSFAEAYFERGRAYDAIGDSQRAAQDYAQALALEPDNSEYRQMAR